MRILWLLSCLGLSSTAQAADFYKLEVGHNGDSYHVSADVHLAAPLADVYAVLTDYDHMTHIAPAIRQSRLLQRLDAHTSRIYTEHHICVAFFCRNIKQTQDVVELTPQDIVSNTLPEQSNVAVGNASLHLDAEGTGTRMHWDFTVQPDFWIPPLLGPSLVSRAMRKTGYDTAEGVERLARAHAKLPPLTPDTDAPQAATQP